MDRKTYNNQKEIYNNRTFTNFKQHRLLRLLKYVPKNKKIKVLDLGCGASQLYDLVKKFRNNINYYGADISEEQVNISKKKDIMLLFKTCLKN